MAQADEKALRITLLAAFILVAAFGLSLYKSRPQPSASEEQAKQDQGLIDVVQKTAPTIGDAQAPVTIAEFSDFQCPYCKTVSPYLDRAMKEYPGKIRRVWIHTTNPTAHPQSESAAVASVCAHQQGQFWAFHDKLFETQDNLGAATYNQIAQALSLDVKIFQTCLAGKDALATVRSHTQFAQRAGVTATPYVTVNNTVFTGEFTWEELRNAIEKALASAQQTTN